MSQKADYSFLLVFDKLMRIKEHLLTVFEDKIENLYTHNSLVEACKEYDLKNIDIIFIDAEIADISVIQKIKTTPYPAIIYFAQEKNSINFELLNFQNSFVLDLPIYNDKIKNIIIQAMKHKAQVKAFNVKMTELKNQIQEERYYYDHAPSMIIAAKDNKILRANVTFLDFFGYSSLDDFNSSHTDLLSLSIPIKGYIERDRNWMEAIMSKPLGYKKVVFKSLDGELVRFHIEHKNIKEGVVQFAFSDITTNEEITGAILKECLVNQNNASAIFKTVWENLRREMSRAKRYHHIFSVLTFCVSDEKYHLDKIDTRSDKIFPYIEKITNELLRPTDTFSKWSNNRYIILAAHTAPSNAKKLCLRLIEKFEALPQYKQGAYNIHFGITYFKEKDDRMFLFKRAQNYLTKALNAKEKIACDE